MWARIANILIGLLLMVAPGIWAFEKTAADNNHIVAPLVITFSITALWEVNRSVRLFNIPVGAWLVISAFVFDYTVTGMILNIAGGILLVIFSLVKGTTRSNYGGGWRSLFEENPAHLQAANKGNTV